MAIKMGINGFGRIGRNVCRAAMARGDIDIVAVNDLNDAELLAHLLKYDSVHGELKEEVTAASEHIFIGGKRLAVFSEKDPALIPWKKAGADIVIESTGRFAKREAAQKHLQGGAGKVLISSPASGEDITIVMGVNEKKYNHRIHHVISNASCTTNCLAPVAKVLHEEFGIVRGMMTTVHSYTNDQRILDFPHKDYRRARAAAESIIPTTTGAAQAVSLVLPELEGKLSGMAMRVPVPNVSVVDLVAELNRNVSAEDVNEALRKAACGSLAGILGYSTKPLVSRDYNGSTYSAVIDGLSTIVLENRMVKVVSWYDNETGYSNRILDLAIFIEKSGMS